MPMESHGHRFAQTVDSSYYSRLPCGVLHVPSVACAFMCSLSQTQREKSIPDAAFSMGARHKNSIRSQLFFADMCKRRAALRIRTLVRRVRTEKKHVRQQGNVSADFLHFDHCPVHFWSFPCHFVCAFAKKVHKNTKNMLF